MRTNLHFKVYFLITSVTILLQKCIRKVLATLSGAMFCLKLCFYLMFSAKFSTWRYFWTDIFKLNYHPVVFTLNYRLVMNLQYSVDSSNNSKHFHQCYEVTEIFEKNRLKPFLFFKNYKIQFLYLKKKKPGDMIESRWPCCYQPLVEPLIYQQPR